MDRESAAPVVIGRYALYDKIASGGMAAVYLGRLAGPVGFARTVAIKRLHAQFASDPDFVTMFLDEARLAARIQHPNVVATLDVVAENGELFLVMEYVRGESASQLVRRMNERNEYMPPRIVGAIVSGVLQGLHAAHEASDESGNSLGIVHRDVSPQNIIVGLDGTPRVLDFGVAKAEGKFHSTRGGEIKGKILYMSPEQLEADNVDRTTDVYAMGLVLFELVTGKRMFQKTQDMTSLGRILRNEITLPSSLDPSLARWDAVVRRASGPRHERYRTARDMALDVERVFGIASPVEVADWVEHVAGETIRARIKLVQDIESGSAKRMDPQAAAAALRSELAKITPAPIPVQQAPEPHVQSERTAGSQVSHAIDPEMVDFRPKSRWRKVIPFALFATVVMGGAAFYVSEKTQPTQAAAQPPPPESTTAAAAVTSAPPTPTPPPPAASSAVVETPPPPPKEIEVVEEAPTATTKSTIKKHTGSPKRNCDKPYTVDAQGHMHFRTECL